MVKEIIHGEKIFNQQVLPAQKTDLDIAKDLKETLIANKANAIGLAANMIGSKKNIIAIFQGPLAVVMLNPKIKAQEEPYLASEGCLCLEGERSTIRFKKITVEYMNENFEKRCREFDGIEAEAVQHEIDHEKGKII